MTANICSLRLIKLRKAELKSIIDIKHNNYYLNGLTAQR